MGAALGPRSAGGWSMVVDTFDTFLDEFFLPFCACYETEYDVV